MKRKQGIWPRLAALLLAAALCAVLAAGCSGGAGADNRASGAALGQTEPSAPQESMDMETAADGEGGLALTATASGGSGSASLTDVLPENRKIILNADISMESTDFDAACAALRAAAQEAGGYLASSQQETPSYEGASRWTQFVFRIPAEQYDSFLASADAAGNVTSLSETTQDITAEYVDVEARIEALTAQQERLLDLLGQAGDLETLLAIQNQLTEVQYQLESYEGQKRVYDDQVEYSTITVTLDEVVHLTEPADTFGQRLGAAFADSWRGFGSSLQNLAVWLVASLPTLLVLALLALCVVLAVKKYRRSRRASRAAAQEPAGLPVEQQVSPAARQPEAPEEKAGEQGNTPPQP